MIVHLIYWPRTRSWIYNLFHAPVVSESMKLSYCLIILPEGTRMEYDILIQLFISRKNYDNSVLYVHEEYTEPCTCTLQHFHGKLQGCKSFMLSPYSPLPEAIQDY